MSTNRYTRVQATEANPEKSGWYDTDCGQIKWNQDTGIWDTRHNDWPEYWYKPAEETELTFTCGDCGQKLTEVRPGSHQCDNEKCIQNSRPMWDLTTKTNEND